MYNPKMHRTETADSFRRFSEISEVLFGLSKYSDAVSAGDLSVLQTLRYAPGLQNGGAGFVQRSAEGCRTSRMKLTKNLQVIRRPHYVREPKSYRAQSIYKR